jgi:hypothetical protein
MPTFLEKHAASIFRASAPKMETEEVEEERRTSSSSRITSSREKGSEGDFRIHNYDY